MSNSLDPDQARHFVGPDLGPNCLQKLSADDTTDKELEIKHSFYIHVNHGTSANRLLLSDLGLHCFLMPISLNILVQFNLLQKSNNKVDHGTTHVKHLS